MVTQEQVHEVETVRTSIDDLTVLGEELSEEALRLVAGGQRSAGGSTNPGATDDYPY